mmetsp:Transcript_36634/g.74734  ORF Transcript_36634/g.74734 Transcript_36634/m.74734 type:complete len:351 (-) Transcript_36634:84-1136(-)|eukprot:CAMPEP_0183297730 /NCGR_PEP_ID=MMETSP0160_2-20130417/4940_1 /TAXON_ID=2839 ORGANISM="Odontella Sinensis, Strain Grunow 1884" /NCGR_SAMPLE_ID=MMETSP0160_2 /ASSEMBLY_ACC=CAM_ASM_000250 /LENGTH=350 /DNA_ID=CAMNT_0025459611 /DNA_START=173 /DNA_END=1225 /DNA_ORIENTATION=+
MKLLLSLFLALQLSTAESKKGGKKGKKVPEIGSLMDRAFPMWEVDGDGRRVEYKECTVESCEWNPYYLTKRYDGLHPNLGGHPTDIDVRYAFYKPSAFMGQPGGGSPHHCPEDYDNSLPIQACPKIKTKTDDGPSGPGHIPPHIALASLTWATEERLIKRSKMFDYDLHGCRVVPDVLLHMIRHYFPRTVGEYVDYPPPITPEGGDYQYEFPSGRGVENQGPPYEPGPPHWCTADFLAAGQWPDFCPYVFEGPDAGKYRHPHIAYAALEVYLANMEMPDKCATTWLENNPDFLEQTWVPTNIAFPDMDADDFPDDSVEHWMGQPVLPYNYDGSTGKKAAAGAYITETLFK